MASDISKALTAAQGAVRRAQVLAKDVDTKRLVSCALIIEGSSDLETCRDDVLALLHQQSDSASMIAALRTVALSVRRELCLPQQFFVDAVMRMVIDCQRSDPQVTATAVLVMEACVAVRPDLTLRDFLVQISAALPDAFERVRASPSTTAAEGVPAWCELESLLLALRGLCTGMRLATNKPAGPELQQGLMDKCSQSAAEFSDSSIPYLRAAALSLFAAILQLACSCSDAADVVDGVARSASTALISDCASSTHPHAHLASLSLARVLVDNVGAHLEPVFPSLLPWLCYSRYFGQERHRFVAVETWKRLVNLPPSSLGVEVSPVGGEPTSDASGPLPPPGSGATTPTQPMRRSRWYPSGREGRGGPDASPMGGADGQQQQPSRARAASPMRRFSVSAYLSAHDGSGDEGTSAPPPSSMPAGPSPTSHGEASAEAASSAGVTGPRLIERHIDAVVQFYVAHLASPSVDAREAACHCTAELAGKIDADVVRPHAECMLTALLACLDASAAYEMWPARDAGVVATAKLAVSFFVSPDKSGFDGPARDLPALWLRVNGHDEHRMVRDHAAMVLGLAMAALGVAPSSTGSAAAGAPTSAVASGSPGAPVLGISPQALSPVKQVAQSPSLFALRGSPLRGHADPSAAAPSTHPLVVQIRDTIHDLLSSQAAANGAPDYAPSPPASEAAPSSLPDSTGAHWRAVDGSIYAVRELSAADPPSAAGLLPLLAECVSLRACPWTVRESLAHHLPEIARCVGKQAVKRCLDGFLQPLLDLACAPPVNSDSRGAAFAALDCVSQLRKLVGPSIFEGRLSPQQAAQLRAAETRP